MNYSTIFSTSGVIVFVLGVFSLSQSVFSWSLNLQQSFWAILFAVALLIAGNFLTSLDKSQHPKE